MNRIVQRHFSYRSVQDLEALHDSFLRVLGVSVPPSVAALYATPRVSTDGTVQWDTSFAGQPTPYADLPESAATHLRIVLFERLRALGQCAEAYAAQPNQDPHLLRTLRDASADPPVEAIYSVGGQPVLLFWDRAIVADSPRKVLAAPIIPLVTASASTLPLWKWLLGGLLLLLLLFFLWWFWCPRSPFNRVELPIQPPVIEPVAVVTPEPTPEPTPTKPIPVPEPPKPEPEPEPEPVPKPADLPIIDPEPEPVPEPEPAPAPEPIPVPEPLKPPKPVPPPPKPKPVAKPPATITTAKNLCPEDRPAALAPEMVVVFDSSGSMMVNINATREDEQWLFAKLNRPQAILFLSGQDRQRFEYLTRQPTRMTTAQQATIDVMKRLPSDIGSGLVVVDACPTANNIGRFGPSERGAMINQLRGLRPHQGTPLADGILEAGKLVDGVNKESTILLVSDGGESCGGDPCLVARNLARQKPHLKINVVDIGGTGAAACVAQATGGKVYSVSSIAELNAGINSAAKDALGPSTCKK
ncbi:MAG: hypothetical protein NBV66_09715 [Burkholderiaceae bacterium]|nr:hypothetical protein [Burkholderiaceae bacterium]